MSEVMTAAPPPAPAALPATAPQAASPPGESPPGESFAEALVTAGQGPPGTGAERGTRTADAEGAKAESDSPGPQDHETPTAPVVPTDAATAIAASAMVAAVPALAQSTASPVAAATPRVGEANAKARPATAGVTAVLPDQAVAQAAGAAAQPVADPDGHATQARTGDAGPEGRTPAAATLPAGGAPVSETPVSAPAAPAAAAAAGAAHADPAAAGALPAAPASAIPSAPPADATGVAPATPATPAGSVPPAPAPATPAAHAVRPAGQETGGAPVQPAPVAAAAPLVELAASPAPAAPAQAPATAAPPAAAPAPAEPDPAEATATATPAAPPVLARAESAPAPTPVAPPPPPPPPAAPVPLHELPRAAGVAIRFTAVQGGGSARILLHPQDLGAVEIHLRSSADGISATLRADSPQAAQTLTLASDELRRALEAQGLPVLSLDVSDGSRRQAAQDDPEAPARRPLGADAGAEEDGAPTSAPLRPLESGSQIDVLA